MRVLMVAVCLLVLAVENVWASDYSIELTQEQLQKAVAARMPAKMEKMFSSLTLSNPQVVLNENSDRIGLEVDLDFNLAGTVSGKGKGLIDGNIIYVREEGEFHFVNPVVKTLQVDGVAPQFQESIRQLADATAKQELAKKPVYTLDGKDLKQKLAKAVLRSALVKNGKLVLFLQF